MTGTNKKPKWRSIEAKPQSEAESAYLSALSDILPKLSPKEVRRIGFAIKAAFHDGAAWLEAAQLEGLCEVAQS